MSLFLDICGVIGNVGFGVGCLPTAWRTARAGRSIGTPVSLAWTLSIACLTFYIYLLGTYGWSPFIGIIGAVETVSWTTVLWFHYFPREALSLGSSVGSTFDISGGAVKYGADGAGRTPPPQPSDESLKAPSLPSASAGSSVG